MDNHVIIACIPAYNAGRSIAEVVKEAKKYVHKVIVINDGSADDTEQQALTAGAQVVNHPRNLGYGAAILSCLNAGINNNADVIITLDADLQHNPKDIPSLAKPIIDGEADIVTGSRFINNLSMNVPAYRKFGIQLITKVTNAIAQTSVTDATTGFRAYSNHAARVLTSKTFSSGMAASSQIIIEAFRSKLKVNEVHVDISYDTGVDNSTEKAIPMGMKMLTSIIHYVTLRRPLLMIGVPGAIMFTIGIISLAYLLDIFNHTRQIALGLGLFTIGTGLIGILLIITAMILYSLANLSNELSAYYPQRRSRAYERNDINR